MKKGLTYRLQELFATGFYSGYIPVMPGTFGTLAGCAIYIALSRFVPYYYLLVALFFILSVTAADFAERNIFKIKDAPAIVIDEIVGFFITMLSFRFDGTYSSFLYLSIGFLLFRFFDIAKPFPIKGSQKLKGGLGVVIDDVIAGLYANLVLQIIRGFI